MNICSLLKYLMFIFHKMNHSLKNGFYCYILSRTFISVFHIKKATIVLLPFTFSIFSIAILKPNGKTDQLLIQI